MSQISFFIDGFNLYHSVCDAIKDKKIVHGKWLNIKSMCANYLHLFGTDVKLSDVYYFSAFARHTKDADAPKRHDLLIQALQSTGVREVMGKFKKKEIKCRAQCGQKGLGYEEKETDVNIAVRLIEALAVGNCDIAVIVSGDTDLSPAIKVASRMFPTKQIACAFPYKRSAGRSELKTICHKSFNLDPLDYQRFQFPDEVKAKSGVILEKPASW